MSQHKNASVFVFSMLLEGKLGDVASSVARSIHYGTAEVKNRPTTDDVRI